MGGAASGNRSDALTVSVRDAEDNFEHSGITCGKDLAHDRECSLRMLLARHCSEAYYVWLDHGESVRGDDGDDRTVAARWWNRLEEREG